MLRERCLFIVAAVLLAASVASARQEAARSPRNASYSLDARLDVVNHLILGRGRLTWRNISDHPASELRFHMYWNAWRDQSSTWLRELALTTATPLPARRPEDAGLIDLTSLSIATPAGPHDLLARAHYIAPDDGNADDRTVLSVPLDQPIAPGETVDVEFAWNAHVPRPVARTGVLDKYFFVAQWFPKIGVLEDAGWNCHQFHLATEFFADYGTYDVRLTVPSGWTLGATGREQSRTTNADQTTTHRYTEADVHDFAWTTSPDFVEKTERFDENGLPPVDIRLLLQPEHVDQADRHFEAARFALRFFMRWFGAYPYGHLTIVDPVTPLNPEAQGDDTGGMEYPTLITAGTRWIAPWRGVDPAEVVIHEIGHQFWYGIVGSNEFEHAWIDEGITTYVTARVMDEAYPGRFVATDRYFGGLAVWPYEDVRWRPDVQGVRLDAYRRAGPTDAGTRPTWRYWPAAASATTYARTALWLTSLERMLGWDTMRGMLAGFFERGAFRHPTPEEFIETASTSAGRDLTPFFDAMYRSGATFDYAVEAVDERTTAAGAIDSAVVLRRLAGGVFPVEVHVTFDDGSDVTQSWDGADRWHTLAFRRGAHVTSVEVDPRRIVTLDRNYTNNTWARDPHGAEAGRRWAARWLTWFENVLLTYAFFA
jgi:hypothetical protein